MPSSPWPLPLLKGRAFSPSPQSAITARSAPPPGTAHPGTGPLCNRSSWNFCNCPSTPHLWQSAPSPEALRPPAGLPVAFGMLPCPGPHLVTPSPAPVSAICPRCSLSPAPRTPLAPPSLTCPAPIHLCPQPPPIPAGSLPVASSAPPPPLPLHTEGHTSLPGVPGPCPAAPGTPHRMPPAPSSWQPHPLHRGSSSFILSPPVTEAGILRVTLAFLSSVTCYVRSIRNGFDL